MACSGESCPWADVEIKRLVDAVKTYGEWGKWAAIAAMVPNRSGTECRLMWTSATPVWTPQEDMLLATAVKACDEGIWLQVASRVPGRTRMDCLNRWTLLVEKKLVELTEKASWTSQSSTDRFPWTSGEASNPVDVVETCGEENGATFAAVAPGWSETHQAAAYISACSSGGQSAAGCSNEWDSCKVSTFSADK